MSDKPDEKNAGSASDAPPTPDFTAAAEPFLLFETWIAEATRSEINDPNAMAVATADPSGLPNLRMVLMKGLDGPERRDRGLFSIPISKVPRGGSSKATRRRRCSFTGSHCGGRCGSAVRCNRSAPPRRMPTTPRVRAAAGWAPGRRRSRGRSKAGLRSKRPLR